MIVRPPTWFGCGIGIGCILLIASGCGGPGYGSPVPVSGTVAVDDAPLPNAVVTYNSTEGREAEYKSFMATSGPDGTYTIESVYPGPYEVFVSEAAADVDPGEASAMAGQDLQPVTGELKTVVGTDAHTFDIKLKRGSPPRG